MDSACRCPALRARLLRALLPRPGGTSSSAGDSQQLCPCGAVTAVFLHLTSGFDPVLYGPFCHSAGLLLKLGAPKCLGGKRVSEQG